MEKNLDYIEKTEKRNLVFEGKILKVYVDDVVFPDGKRATREVVGHNGAVCVIAVDDDGNILMEKQYRHAIGDYLTELPAGKLDKGEIPENAAKRELKEETGAVAESMEYLGFMYPTCGYSDEKIYFYLAKGLKFGETSFDEDEYVECRFLSKEELEKKMASGDIHDGKTVFGLSLYFSGLST